MTRTPSRSLLALPLSLLLASPLACKSKEKEGGDTDSAKTDSGAAPDKDPDTKTSTDTGATEKPAGEHDDPRALAIPISKAEAPLTTPAKGSKQLPNSLKELMPLYSLAATTKLPDWGASGESEAKLSRDDDLDTAWICESGGDKPCVLGLALPEPAKVSIIRIYGAGGPRFAKDYQGHPRLKKVRVHTQAGYVDVELPDGAQHDYIRFDTPVETQMIALELLDVHKGRNDAKAHFAEVELYGTDGAPRPPISLDPQRAFVSWETTAWDGGEGGKHTIRQTFVEFLSDEPPTDPAAAPASRRFTRATAVYGLASDDFLLFEKLFGTDCTEIEGSYLLFDRRNRMFYPLTDLGGAGAPVYRHREGRGFAVGWIRPDEFTVEGIVEEAGELKRKRAPKQPPEDGKALLAEWGFETEPLNRGGSLEQPPSGCSVAKAGELDAMVSAADLPMGGELNPAQWLVCSVGTDTLYATATCDAPAQAYLVAGGKLVGKHVSKNADARGLRLRRVGDALLVELSAEQGDTATLAWAAPGLFALLEKAGGLYVRPPKTCASCQDEWASETEDETGGETGGSEGVAEGEPEELDEEELEPAADEELEPADEDEPEDEAPAPEPAPPPVPG